MNSFNLFNETLLNLPGIYSPRSLIIIFSIKLNRICVHAGTYCVRPAPILCWDNNCTIIRLNLFFYNIAIKYAAKDVIFAIIIIGVSCVVAGAMRIAFEESPSSTGQGAG